MIDRAPSFRMKPGTLRLIAGTLVLAVRVRVSRRTGGVRSGSEPSNRRMR
ncbi:hypothetical protein FTUN_1516 [Frigoriglobus tundricola]|uniref:Uncharacterized protein n=1 Tax=Frigoriglobus tundricola TaxID=2774151 RepID=A0A6M5YIV9_9BACT|nr:hypothetical protein FTUN_1516 [Frigoriglobus tundricola]